MANVWSDEASDASVAVAEAVSGLIQQRRVVVVLHYWLDYSLQDIADVLGLPIGTVMSRLSRARADLRDSIKENEHAA